MHRGAAFKDPNEIFPEGPLVIFPEGVDPIQPCRTIGFRPLNKESALWFLQGGDTVQRMTAAVIPMSD